MVFVFGSGIVDVAHLDLHPQARGRLLHLEGQLRQVVDLFELVEDPVLPLLGGCSSPSVRHCIESRSGKKPRLWWPVPKGVKGCPMTA
jgi:hypothetical protein